MDTTTTATQMLRLPSLPVLLSFLLFLLMLIRYWKNSNGQGKQPPGPKPLPILGNLHQLADGQPHHVMTKLCRKYGPVMKLKLGQLDAVIISSPEAAKEVLKTNEIKFAQRPEVYAVEIMSYDHSSIVFAPYGDYWREMRKISVLELLSNKRVQSFRSIREDEVWGLVEFISSNQGRPINLSEKIFTMTNDIIARAAFGRKNSDQHNFTVLLEEIMKIGAGFAIADLYPSLTFLRPLTGVKPAKAKILINLHAIGRDPTVWKDPECFRPERFEGSSTDFKGNHFELIPFGGGRRICPGISFATANIELGLAQLMYHFDWKLANGERLEDLDMSENFGMTARRKENLQVIATTRIPFEK